MARQSRFIIRRIASCTGGALHESAFSDETAPFYSAMKHFRFRSNMKHSAYTAYDEKMKNESLSICNATLSALYYNLRSSPLWLDFFILILPKEPQAFIANHRPGREFRKNKICRNFKIFVRYYRKSPLL